MKIINIVAVSLCLSACGGSETPVNPFQPVVQNESAGSPLSDETGPIEQTATTPEPEPVAEPTQTGGGNNQTPEPVRGACVDTPPVNDGFGWDGVDTCTTPIVAEPEPEEEPVTEQAPEFTDPHTNKRVALVPAAFTVDTFALNGGMWECVDVEYGLQGDFWSFIPDSKGVVHRPDGTADLFEGVNSNIVAAGSGLLWSIENGVYFGPLPLHGARWVQDHGNGHYSVWLSDYKRRDCYERVT